MKDTERKWITWLIVIVGGLIIYFTMPNEDQNSKGFFDEFGRWVIYTGTSVGMIFLIIRIWNKNNNE